MSFREHFKPFSCFADTEKTRAFLPHWEQAGCSYFVTWRMADSVPMEKLRRWQQDRAAWTAAHPKPWNEETWKEFGRCFEGQMQTWLDLGEGSRFLSNRDARELVVQALHHFDGQRYFLGDYVVMPNHVHVLFTPLVGFELKKLLHSWKSYTAKAILKRFPEAPNPFWLQESFDHIVRSEGQLAHFQRYIRENPMRAFLKPGAWTCWEPE